MVGIGAAEDGVFAPKCVLLGVGTSSEYPLHGVIINDKVVPTDLASVWIAHSHTNSQGMVTILTRFDSGRAWVGELLLAELG
jgi:hypothetical protein